jgi:hypothetical protein
MRVRRDRSNVKRPRFRCNITLYTKEIMIKILYKLPNIAIYIYNIMKWQLKHEHIDCITAMILNFPFNAQFSFVLFFFFLSNGR